MEEKDVKKAPEASAEAPAESADKGKPEDSKEEVFEDDGKRTIPYTRFKEKVGEVNELKEMIETLKAEKQAAVEKTAADYQTYYEGEMARVLRQKGTEENDYSDLYQEEPKRPAIDETVLNPLKEEIETLRKELTGLKSESETRRLKTQIKSLKEVYPELDEEHVLVVKKMKPKMSLDECAEYSHKYFSGLVKSKFDRMMEKKKEAARKPIVTAEGRLNIPSDKKPKTFAEAKKAMLEYARQLEKGA